MCRGFGHIILARLPLMFLRLWRGVMATTINHAWYPSQ